jgi:S-adenosylmethionine hydrolase
VDLAHGIRPYAIGEASFILARAFDIFAPGSIFLTVVDPGVGGARKNLVFQSCGRYLVAPDNGLVSDVAASFEIDSVFQSMTTLSATSANTRRSGGRFLGAMYLDRRQVTLPVGGR